jgi:hypothetical protein
MKPAMYCLLRALFNVPRHENQPEAKEKGPATDVTGPLFVAE